MSVRAYNPEDNSPVLLSDTEAADAITSGRYVLADDQAVPVREPSGAINRYRAADLPRLLSQPGYALDFVNGNQRRYEELYRERTSDVLRQEYGAAGEVAATTAMAVADGVSFGLANQSLRQDEEDRLASVRSNTPNQGEVEKYLNSGYSYDDALLLANPSYRRPTITEAMDANSPVASAIGSALGLVGSVAATLPVSLPAEAAIAARATAALASRGLGATAASVGGRVAAGAAIGATETAAITTGIRVGEGIIREQLPEISAEETMIMGGLGAVIGGGLPLLLNAPRIFRSRAAGTNAPIVAPIASNRDAIQRLTDDITSSLSPESVTKPQTIITELNRTVGQVDPTLNASFFNDTKVGLAAISDAAHDDAANIISLRVADIDSNVVEVERLVADRTRRELRQAAEEFTEASDSNLLRQTARGINEYVDRFVDTTAFAGRGLMEGRESSIVSAIRRNGNVLDAARSGLKATEQRIAELETELAQRVAARRTDRLAAEANNFYAAHRSAVTGIENATDLDYAQWLRTLDPARQAAIRQGVLAQVDDFARYYNRLPDREFVVESLDREILSELPVLYPRLADQVKALPETFVNVQANLANLSRSVKSSAEQDLAQLADEVIQSYDNFLVRADVFGPKAAVALRDIPAIRTMQSNRNQFLRLLGRDGISELDRVERNLDPGKLVNLSTRSSDAETIAGRKVIADYLRAAKNITTIPEAAGMRELGSMIDDTATRLSGTTDKPLLSEAPFFAVGRAKADLRKLQLQSNRGGTLRGVAPSVVGAVLGGAFAGGSYAIPAAGIVSILAMRPDKRVAAAYALRRLKAGYSGLKERLVTAVSNRLAMPSATLAVSTQVARRVITPVPELFEGDTRDEAFDRLVANINEASGNPNYVTGVSETLGINPTSRNGSETITNLVAAIEYMRQQMPDSLFDPMNPNPPSQRVSSMVKYNILKSAETIMDPLSVYDDFANGFVSAPKVQALRAVYPQTAEEMNARVLAEYADRVSVGTRMPYATRVQASMLLGTPIEQALRQPNLARLQSIYAQTPAQAQAQGMSRTPTRAVTSLVTSTTTEGASLQDLQ